MARWGPDRIWDAVEAWRWIPPSATRVVTDEYELAVTAGSYALTHVYGFRVLEPERADGVLEEVRRRIVELGGTGTRFHLTPRSRPTDLPDRLRRQGYAVCEEADVLVWELRDHRGAPRFPEFRPSPGVTVREVVTDEEFASFVDLAHPIFGDPSPSAEVRREFLSEFHRRLNTDGHSDRFLAWRGDLPVGRAGMEIVDRVNRFWGTGVLEADRGQGIYGALVRARCEAGLERGAEIALVTARVGTSGPILLRHGFQRVGATQVFEAHF